MDVSGHIRFFQVITSRNFSSACHIPTLFSMLSQKVNYHGENVNIFNISSWQSCPVSGLNIKAKIMSTPSNNEIRTVYMHGLVVTE
jgi:hypothetical protein